VVSVVLKITQHQWLHILCHINSLTLYALFLSPHLARQISSGVILAIRNRGGTDKNTCDSVVIGQNIKYPSYQRFCHFWAVSWEEVGIMFCKKLYFIPYSASLEDHLSLVYVLQNLHVCKKMNLMYCATTSSASMNSTV